MKEKQNIKSKTEKMKMKTYRLKRSSYVIKLTAKPRWPNLPDLPTFIIIQNIVRKICKHVSREIKINRTLLIPDEDTFLSFWGNQN